MDANRPTPDPENALPFQVTVRPVSPAPASDREALDPVLDSLPDESEGDALSVDEIEAAYLKALAAAEFVEDLSQRTIDDAIETSLTELQDSESAVPSSDTEAVAAAEEEEEETTAEACPEDAFENSPDNSQHDESGRPDPTISDIAGSSVPAITVPADHDAPVQSLSQSPVSEPITESPAVAESPGIAPAVADSLPAPNLPPAAEEPEEWIQPQQVLEALLFVGGKPLPARQLSELLGGSTTVEQVETMLSQMNAVYQAEGRPYEIHLQTGGYLLQLRSEFEPVRQRAFGQGPREVKLAQEALEILAFIAYQQPIGKEAIEATEKQGIPGILRQLLRRQLISLDRQGADTPAQYRTTPRFLSLFGLESLDDLPQAADFSFK
jgi:segregation and condensation protein B